MPKWAMIAIPFAILETAICTSKALGQGVDWAEFTALQILTGILMVFFWVIAFGKD